MNLNGSEISNNIYDAGSSFKKDEPLMEAFFFAPISNMIN
jgi:hypothetical protein